MKRTWLAMRSLTAGRCTTVHLRFGTAALKPLRAGGIARSLRSGGQERITGKIRRPGEIVPAGHHGFYSSDAKYVDAEGALLEVPADLPQELEGRLRRLAKDAFRALGCDGMARVDFFVTADMRVLVNEVNTIPGFTDISMYAKAMAASGVTYGEVIDRLVAHGLARAARDTAPSAS